MTDKTRAVRDDRGQILQPAKTICTMGFQGEKIFISRQEWVLDMACRLAGYYSRKNFAVSREVGLPEGRSYTWQGKEFPYTVSRQRADFIAINKSGLTVIVETKTCWSDFAADKKWAGYLQHCHKFYFGADPETAQKIAEHLAPLPEADGVGVISIDPMHHGAMTFLRPARKHERQTPVGVLLWQMAARSSGFSFGVNNGSIFE